MFAHPSSSPIAAAAAAGCTPGSDGIPGGAAGRVLCGDYPLGDWWQTLAGHWPAVVAVLVGLLAARAGTAWWRRRRWRDHAAQARWLEITPPISANPTTTVQLWRLLATVLPAPRWWQQTPPRLVWEVAASDGVLRAGLWVPPGINPSAVIRIVQRAWPGARLEHAPTPTLSDRGTARELPVVACQLRPTIPEWLPLIDEPPTTSVRRDGAVPVEQDHLRAVYDGLAAAGRTGGGLLQVHLCRAPAGRIRMLRRATVDPRRAHHRRSGGSVVGGVLVTVLSAIVRAVLDLITPGPAPRSHHTSGRQLDPYLAQQASQARAKYAAGPHLLTAVYAAAAGPTRAAAKAACDDISSGYGLVATAWTRRRLRRRNVEQRWAATGQMSLVSVGEAAALAGLPAEPSAHGLPAAASRRRPAGRDIWTTTGTRPAPPVPEPPASRRTAAAHPDDGSQPHLWSIP